MRMFAITLVWISAAKCTFERVLGSAFAGNGYPQSGSDADRLDQMNQWDSSHRMYREGARRTLHVLEPSLIATG